MCIYVYLIVTLISCLVLLSSCIIFLYVVLCSLVLKHLNSFINKRKVIFLKPTDNKSLFLFKCKYIIFYVSLS